MKQVGKRESKTYVELCFGDVLLELFSLLSFTVASECRLGDEVLRTTCCLSRSKRFNKE